MGRLLNDVLAQVLADYAQPEGEPVLIGYARVSTAEQKLNLQIDALIRAGVDPNNIYTDTCSGVAKRRPGLEAAFADMRSGDVLVCWRLDRLARSLLDLLNRLQWMQERNIGFRCTAAGIDTTTISGRLVMQITGAIAEFERELIRERAKAGMEAAKARGKKFGRPLKIDLKKAEALLRKGIRVQEVARRLGVAEPTIYAHFPTKVLLGWRKRAKKK